MMIYLYFMFLCGIWVFCSNRKHLIIMLLSLEFIVLVLYLVLYYFMYFFDFELFFLVMFLTFSVCEGALGLSILVSMIRSCGNDYLSSCNMLQC
uniref:NADH dehydrogenase subunit 4L n=1 Tax=Allacta hainanensis TaxID=3037030 RepID=UPI0027A4DC55|nr:NADH dehydrogenase subunit 4L [Allacta hainanensis]WGO56998.1 NADH dehydrogenase subunit 4L [Allacta hainanensis]